MAGIEDRSAQVAVIGDLIIAPEKMGEAMTLLTAEEFTHTGCRVLWVAMVNIFRAGGALDITTLSAALDGQPELKRFAYECMEITPTAANFRAHAEAAKRQSMAERLRDIGTQMQAAGSLEEMMQLVDQAEQIRISRTARRSRSMGQMLQSFGERHADSAEPDYIPWPFAPLSSGFHVSAGKYIIIGGYPSDGKTAFALACGFSQAERGKRVVFYSYETDLDDVEDRSLSTVAGISGEVIQENRLTQKDWEKYAIAASEAAGWPFQTVEASGMTVDDIRADALSRRADVIYIDYIQLISPGKASGRYESRFDAVTRITNDLQQLAKTTGITVVALSQLTRPTVAAGRKPPPPNMHSLRESGYLEQSADGILLLYREDVEDIRAQRVLRIAKNKRGRTGTFWLDFDGELQRFAVAQKRPEDMPKKIRKKTGTPSIAPEAEQMGFEEITEEDDQLPF